MAKKRFYLTYNKIEGEVIEIKVRSFNGKILDDYKFNAKDTLRYGKIIDSIFRKYGYRPTITYKDSVNFKEEEKKKTFEDTGFFD